ncbi:amidase family protein [Ichthyenterobacterium magnum]|uniref:amidase family protein n=1 Tax=Ichthyenterobacterium magnum TaxID=1230530 RepID=UPI0026BD20E7|nr:amidase family protein [Ichthyenterobacterium magnum]
MKSIYNNLKPFVLEQDIPTLQKHITSGELSYEKLTKFYLYRIRKFDRANNLSLNSVIALNPNVIQQARQKDKEFLNKKMKHPIFGMPILLKDNVNASDMPTTAGAVALQDNNAEDAFIVKQLKKQGALILGKANLSEWAYFFCGECPSGYSAIGGQTLNPYGRKIIDTGGSSSGSGVATSANFCAASIGSETSGSILSPASQNSVVGLKPTIGLVSRSGIIPISSTLDTAGPITKNVIDNAILLDAIFGEDKSDSKSIFALWGNGFYVDELVSEGLKGKRFGAYKEMLEKEPLYVSAIEQLKKRGAEIVVIEENEDIKLPDFLRLLNLDMQKDLPIYLSKYADDKVALKSVEDVIDFNLKDSIHIMPYGQALFKGIVADKATDEEFTLIKEILKTNGKHYFDDFIKTNQLDGVLSINNYHAGYAAVAEYPAITVPMGYKENGAPMGLTFIGKRLSEKQLLQWAYNYEQATKMRKAPVNYN